MRRRRWDYILFFILIAFLIVITGYLINNYNNTGIPIWLQWGQLL